MTAVIALSDLTVDRGGRRVVSDVTLTVTAGSWFGVIGANGSGKTTLLRAIAGRLPITGGTCAILGKETTHDRSGRARAIGFAPPIEALPATLNVG